MSISRRNFIKIGSVSAALVAGNCFGFESGVFAQTNVLSGVSLPSEIGSDLLFSYNAGRFKKLIGSPFNISARDFAGMAVLNSVEDVSFAGSKTSKNIKSKTAENFILSFQISSDQARQETYAVSHSDLGQFDLLLVPAKSARGENLMTAVINRI